MGQIVMDGYMVPFNVLKTQYDLKDVDFFACIQFKSNLGLLISKEHIVQDLDLDIKLREIASGRRTVSRLYELLTTASFVSLSSQHKWEQDLSIHLSNAQWDTPCITKIHNSLIQMCKISNSSNTDLAQGIYNTKQIKENGQIPLPFVLAWLRRGRNIDTSNVALPLSKEILEKCDL